MSDNWINIIPEDPCFIPSESDQNTASRYLSEITPEAEEIQSICFTKVNFHDCGTNLESIHCPHCDTLLNINWWKKQMDKDSKNDEFLLENFSLPCCNKETDLHRLKYYFNQGFGKYRLEAMNPNVAKLKTKQIEKLEIILKTKVRIIYQHV